MCDPNKTIDINTKSIRQTNHRLKGIYFGFFGSTGRRFFQTAYMLNFQEFQVILGGNKDLTDGKFYRLSSEKKTEHCAISEKKQRKNMILPVDRQNGTLGDPKFSNF